MNRQDFVSEIIRLATEQGCEAAETYFVSNINFSVNALNGDFNRYESAEVAGLSLRVKVDGHDGYAYTEAYDRPEALVQHAMDNARSLEIEDEHPMQVKCSYEAVTMPPSLYDRPAAECIDYALKLEAATKAVDPRVKNVMYCEVGYLRAHVEMKNTLGLDASRENAQSYCYVAPSIQDGEEIKTGFAFRAGENALDIEGCAKEAVQDAIEKLGAEPVPSGSYRVLLKNAAAADLLEAFDSVFSAEEAQKGLSLLKDREGDTIGADCISLVDDPFYKLNPRAFDGEGTPTRHKYLIRNGRLETLLHNLKTAKKAGTQSTGNAVRGSAASSVGVGPTTMYFVPGEASFDELVARMGDGLIITNIEGLHAGLNEISGDFSLKAEGFLVEGGKRTKPVHEITVAGNFLTLLKSVEAVGSDLFFGLPSSSTVGSPSLLIQSLAVGGK